MLCEMCGRGGELVQAVVDGAELTVCSSCARYGTLKSSPRPFLPKAIVSRQEQEFTIVPDFSSLLRQARERKDMAREEFSAFLNERESVVAKWEQGTLMPRLDTARRLERLLNLSLVVKEEPKEKENIKSRKSDEFTLGDFIKVRKRGDK